MLPLLANSDASNALLAAGALGIACAAISVFVVAARWALVGEGISHSALGGAGTAWIIMLLFPTLSVPWLPYALAVVFCFATAIAIGYLSRSQRMSSDTAIGIFLVASLAWAFLAQRIYLEIRHVTPARFDTFLFGFAEMRALSFHFAIAAVCASVAVIVTLIALGKEILYYCFDPLLAEASGVRGGLIHYLLMVLLAILIIVGLNIVGAVLVTALLVLPGATAMLLSSCLRNVLAISIVIGLIGAVGGMLINFRWRFIAAGPAVVLLLFVIFVLAYLLSLVHRRPV